MSNAVDFVALGKVSPGFRSKINLWLVLLIVGALSPTDNQGFVAVINFVKEPHDLGLTTGVYCAVSNGGDVPGGQVVNLPGFSS